MIWGKKKGCSTGLTTSIYCLLFRCVSFFFFVFFFFKRLRSRSSSSMSVLTMARKSFNAIFKCLLMTTSRWRDTRQTRRTAEWSVMCALRRPSVHRTQPNIQWKRQNVPVLRFHIADICCAYGLSRVPGLGRSYRHCRELNNVDHVFCTDRLAEITTMHHRVDRHADRKLGASLLFGPQRPNRRMQKKEKKKIGIVNVDRCDGTHVSMQIK